MTIERLEAIEESAIRVKRMMAIRDGKRVILKKRVHSDADKEGYKRDKDGKQVRMTSKERRTRSIAAKKASKKSSTKRNHAKSTARRSKLIK